MSRAIKEIDKFQNLRKQNDTFIIGSNIQAGEEGSAEINAGGNITQAAVKDVNYHYKKTSSSSFFGLISREKSTESYVEEAIKSNTMAGTDGIVYDAANNILMEGVTVVSTGNVS
ncbi:MAG: hypothetical protein LBT51_03135, partial [Fusobacteriaceae bacterium]|nr:hypothetical protein [Fusobacteriaceae bacterium]